MTKNTSARIERLVLWGVALILAVISAAFIYSKAGPGSPPLPVLKTIAPFQLTDQKGNPFSLNDLRGRVWVGSIIFTRCPGPCARMTQQYARLQADLPSDGRVMLASLTADPEYDTPEVLLRFGDRFGAEYGRWRFLTGSKTELYSLAMNGLMLALQETEPEKRVIDEDMFIHSELFVLVDKNGNARAAYDSSEPDTHAKVLAGVKQLLKER